MISVYDFSHYQVFLKRWIKEQKKRGLQGQLASAAHISSTMMSLVLKGEKHLSLEQASLMADYMGLSENECDYFFLLIEMEKAGSQNLKKKLNRRKEELQKKVKKISERVIKDVELTEETRAIYYSSWIYAALRNLAATSTPMDMRSLSSRLQVPSSVIHKALEFLMEQNLLVLHNNQIQVGPAHTYIPKDSPFVNQHHKNWRNKGVERMEGHEEDHLFFTSPMSLSTQDYQLVRNRLLKTIEEIMKIVAPSPSETVACLNIDFFDY